MRAGTPEPQAHWTLRTPKVTVPDAVRHMPSRRVLIIGLAVIAGIVLFCVGLLQTSLFSVKRIDVNLPPNSHINKADVLALAKLKTGEAMIGIDENAVSHRLESNPWIERAHIKSAWPHVVTVSIEERQPVAVVQTTDNKFAQLAADGMVLAVTPIVPGNLPFILDVRTKPEPGSLLDASNQDLMTVADAMPDSLRPHVKQIQFQDNTLKLGLDTGTIVILGDATDMGNKLTSAAAVVSHSDAKQLKILDVRSPHMPVATPLNGTAPVKVTSGSTTTSTTIAKKSKTSTTLAPQSR